MKRGNKVSKGSPKRLSESYELNGGAQGAKHDYLRCGSRDWKQRRLAVEMGGVGSQNKAIGAQKWRGIAAKINKTK